MSQDETTLSPEGTIRIPTNLPPGTVITITITIDGEARVETERPAPPAPEKPKYMGQRTINGGA